MSYRQDATIPTPSRRASAFTIIELLVVISIISLLIALLLPALATARESAQMIQSCSQARQISLALHTYAGDNNSSLPFFRWPTDAQMNQHTAGTFPTAGTAQGKYWPGELYHAKYMPDAKQFWPPGTEYGWGVDGTYKELSMSAMLASRDHWQWGSVRGYTPNYNGAIPHAFWGYDNATRFYYGPHKLDGKGPPPSRHILLYSYYIDYNGAVVRSYMDGSVRAENTIPSAVYTPSSPYGVVTISSNFVEPWFDLRFPNLWY